MGGRGSNELICLVAVQDKHSLLASHHSAKSENFPLSTLHQAQMPALQRVCSEEVWGTWLSVDRLTMRGAAKRKKREMK